MGLRYLGNINKPGYNPLASNITTGVNVVQYQGIFTTQQQLQAITTGQWVTDPVFDYSTLLLQADSIANGSQNNTFLDSSTNNFTITRNGNTTQGTFSPFSLQPGAWANFFDGSSAQLSIANSTNLDLGSGNWTIEAWLFPTAFSGNARFFSKQVGSGNGYAFRLQPTSGYIYAEIDTVNFLTSTVSPALNTWSHVAIVRNSNTVTIYLNGVSVGSASYSSTPSSQNAPTTISGYDISGARSEYFPGYISNLRFVKGTAVYTSNFTPSTTPLTAVTNTQLLTCQSNRFVDNSTNAFSITLNGTPSVQAFSPFAPQFQYTASVTGGSGYFDGTGDTLSVSNAAFNFSSTDCTIEFWFYPTNTGTDLMLLEWGSGASGDLQVVWNSGALTFGTSGVSKTTFAVSRNQWIHVACVKSGTTYYIYINGTRNTSQSGGSASSSTTFYIGSRAASSLFIQGYMSGLKISNTAVYTGTTLTVPAAPPSSDANTKLLANFTNAGILDGTMKNNLETVGNASVSTSVVKYGSGSMYFDGNGDYLLTPTNVPALNLGTGDFTMECWFYLAGSTSSDQQIFSFAAATVSANTDWGFGLSYYGATYSGKVYGFFYSGTTGYEVPSSTALTANTWNHIAYTRLNGIIYLYINGVQQGSLAANVAVNFNTGWALKIGYGHSGATRYLNGYLDDVRITKGIARYTQNFIPPTVALPRQ